MSVLGRMAMYVDDIYEDELQSRDWQCARTERIPGIRVTLLPLQERMDMLCRCAHRVRERQRTESAPELPPRTQNYSLQVVHVVVLAMLQQTTQMAPIGAMDVYMSLLGIVHVSFPSFAASASGAVWRQAAATAKKWVQCAMQDQHMSPKSLLSPEWQFLAVKGRTGLPSAQVILSGFDKHTLRVMTISGIKWWHGVAGFESISLGREMVDVRWCKRHTELVRPFFHKLDASCQEAVRAEVWFSQYRRWYQLDSVFYSDVGCSEHMVDRMCLSGMRAVILCQLVRKTGCTNIAKGVCLTVARRWSSPRARNTDDDTDLAKLIAAIGDPTLAAAVAFPALFAAIDAYGTSVAHNQHMVKQWDDICRQGVDISALLSLRRERPPMPTGDITCGSCSKRLPVAKLAAGREQPVVRLLRDLSRSVFIGDRGQNGALSWLYTTSFDPEYFDRRLSCSSCGHHEAKYRVMTCVHSYAVRTVGVRKNNAEVMLAAWRCMIQGNASQSCLGGLWFPILRQLRLRRIESDLSSSLVLNNLSSRLDGLCYVASSEGFWIDGSVRATNLVVAQKVVLLLCGSWVGTSLDVCPDQDVARLIAERLRCCRHRCAHPATTASRPVW